MKYAATDPAASNPKSTILLLRQKERVVRFTGSPFLSVRRSPIGSRPGQRFHHRFHRDLRAVVGYGVDLPPAAETVFDFFHAGQPLQGRFPHVVSGHEKCGRGISLALCLRAAGTP